MLHISFETSSQFMSTTYQVRRFRQLRAGASARWIVVAVSLGLVSAEGSSVQLIHAGAGSEAMQYLPYSLIPTALVPFYLITHGIVAAQLAAARRFSVALPHAVKA